MSHERYTPVPPNAMSSSPAPVPGGPAPMSGGPAPWPTTSSYPTVPAPPVRRRVPGWLMAVAAATAVVSVVSFLSVLLWPAGGGDDPTSEPLEFHRFAGVAEVAYSQQSRTTLTAVQGDRAYVAWEQNAQLYITAYRLSTGTEQSFPPLTAATQWDVLAAYPDLLVAIGERDSGARLMVGLDPGTGDQRWQQEITGDDRLFHQREGLVWQDYRTSQVRGLTVSGGDQRWADGFNGDDPPLLLRVVTGDELARPTLASGRDVPGRAADSRIVRIDPDRSARVYQSGTGDVRSQGANIATPGDDAVLAYQGRLFVATAEAGYSVLSYDLDNLAGTPQVHYVSQDPDRVPRELKPCGADRVCVRDSPSFDGDDTRLVAVNVRGDGTPAWTQQLPEAFRILPVGDWTVVSHGSESEPNVTAFNAQGNRVLDAMPGVPIRLNDGNFAVFSAALDASFVDEINAFGIALDRPGEPFPLGRVPESDEPENCSWNDRYLVCPSRTAALIWSFAS